MTRQPLKWTWGALALLAVLARPSFAETGEQFFTTYKGRQILQVKVYRDGTVHAADKEVSLAELDRLMEQLPEKDGDIWYYREGSFGKTAEKVVALVLKHRRPICLSETPDYKDCKR